jgi:Kef-type K+ transport system membrane component KefB
MDETLYLQKLLESQFLDILLKLVIIYGVSVIFSGLAKKFKQPAVLGYIIGGILLGLFLGARTQITFLSDLLGGFTIDGKTRVIYELSQIGVIFLLFMAGLGTNFKLLKENIIKSSLVAGLGVIATIVLVIGVFMLVEGDFRIALTMAVVLTSTSISITVGTLKEIGMLHKLTSVVITGAAIIDDILGLVLITLLGIFMNPKFHGLDSEFYFVLAKIFGLFIFIGIVGFIVYKLNEKIIGHSYYIKYHDQILMAVVAFCFILAYLSQLLGVSLIIGAYFAGLMLSVTKLKEAVEKNLNSLAELFFGPLFFMSIGITLDLTNIGGAILIGALIAVVASGGKIIGCGVGARLSGFDKRLSTKIGFGMMPRGEVSYISASLAAGMGLLKESHLSIAVIVIILTSTITPTLLKKVYIHK